MKRRSFLQQFAQGAAAASALLLNDSAKARPKVTTRQRYLRPPGALTEGDFLARCIRCGQCGEACPNRCIEFFSPRGGLGAANTPYITPRSQACILCMKCTQACPTGALQALQRTAEDVLGKVRMGKARVDKTLCLSWQGKSCGVCYRACPLADVAITVGYMEQPTVTEQCVGCGLCERSCIQMPQAIKVIPQHTLESLA